MIDLTLTNLCEKLYSNIVNNYLENDVIIYFDKIILKIIDDSKTNTENSNYFDMNTFNINILLKYFLNDNTNEQKIIIKNTFKKEWYIPENDNNIYCDTNYHILLMFYYIGVTMNNDVIKHNSIKLLLFLLFNSRFNTLEFISKEKYDIDKMNNILSSLVNKLITKYDNVESSKIIFNQSYIRIRHLLLK